MKGEERTLIDVIESELRKKKRDPHLWAERQLLSAFYRFSSDGITAFMTVLSDGCFDDHLGIGEEKH